MLVRWTLEMAPIVVFVVAYGLSDFFAATAALMAATVLVLAVGLVHERRIARFPLLYGGKVLLFGTLTVALRESGYLMVMDTLTSGGFAALLFVTLALRTLFLKRLFGSLFAVDDVGWLVMTRRWAWFFVAHASANEVVRQLASEAAWVAYKGLLIPVLAVFGGCQLLVCRRHRLPGEGNSWGIRVADAPAVLVRESASQSSPA
jgi:intracellular septation protein